MKKNMYFFAAETERIRFKGLNMIYNNAFKNNRSWLRYVSFEFYFDFV